MTPNPDWHDAVSFAIVDGEFTEPEPSRPTRTSRPIGLRWCLSAAGAALLLATAAASLAYYRSRPIVSTRLVSTHGEATADLTGCPLLAQCEVTDGASGNLLTLATEYLPDAQLLRASTVFDDYSAADYRDTLVLRTGAGLTIWLVANCDPRGVAIAGWQSAAPGTGPADIAVVVAGPKAGCSVAVIAQVPPGVAVPGAALRELAADPSTQLHP